MGAQPIIHAVRKMGSFYLSPNDTAVNRPKHAILALEVIGIWSRIDMQFNQIAAHFLTTDVHVVMKMIMSLDSPQARRDMIDSAARHYLDTEEYLIFKAALISTKQSERRRHAFAHHVWFHSPQFPDAILLGDPKEINIGIGADAEYMMRKDPMSATDRTPFLDLNFIYPITEKELHDDIANAKRAYDIVRNLWIMTGTTEEQAATIRRELLADPLISRAFHKMSGKTNHPTPPIWLPPTHRT